MVSYELRAKVQASASPDRYDPQDITCPTFGDHTHFPQNWKIPEERLLLQNFPDVPLSNGLKFEGLANRNSMDYTETYSLKDEELRTMLRGTLR